MFQYTLMINLNDIKDNILTWVHDNLGYNFTFRKYLIESIMYVIKSILNDNRETTIIEAPTGAGKSLISIISAGVLSTYYNKTSYILCSDLFLWQQYADFIEQNNLLSFGYLKGSKGNYTCFVNKQDFSCSKCKLEKISYRQLKDKNWCQRNFYTCVNKCPYMQQRFRAERSKVTLMTYQLWLHHMNLVNTKEGGDKSFPKRDVIFCDECHNIPDIVQQFCSPVLNSSKDITKIYDIIDYVCEENLLTTYNKYNNLFEREDIEYPINPTKQYTYTELYDIEMMKLYLQTIFSGMELYTDDNNTLIDVLAAYSNILYIISDMVSTIDNALANSSLFNTSKIDKKMLSIVKRNEWFSTYEKSIRTFIKAVLNAGKEYLILEVSSTPDTNEKMFTLNCAKEDYLCSDYMLNHSPSKIMLSATVGSHNAFDENIGVKYTTSKQSMLSKIPTTFDYSKSPIYYIPTYKMSYVNKAKDFPKIQEISIKILNANNCQGIIHTGSYENARMFYNACPYNIRKRLFLYGNSKQKEEILPAFKASTNGVLVGPTLTEGIDLPNDYCRFIIIMKVPYPNIKSKIVNKKLELFPTWYNSVTSNTIIQSIGRGVRNEKDYCTTYILDGCFGDLYQKTKDQYPTHITNNIKIITC